ncbi:metallophosphoesterase [Bradyrhizobium prioriisuperbiae]|uniref:metallophosphoesterase n=1 Tax=Bradyrhizobium prioriisuperbiae TaxID=2854389 RepID=UPI0028E8C900|nr:metallophosphoesterase [Bradyrhizobium prioritasuperba]
MTRSYVIPDLHGRHDLLVAALDVIATRAHGDPLTLITLGDYVDKGPHSRQVIATISALQSDPPTGWRMICLMGNHDWMMREAVRKPETQEFWMARGGDIALASYADMPDGGIPEAHVRWLEALAPMHVDRHRVFVHAGVDSGQPLDQQSERTLLWKRYPDDDADGYGERHVVHGLDRFPDGPKLLRGRTNLDTMAWATGRLVIGVFENDRPGGPVDLIEVRGVPFAAPSSSSKAS